MIVAADVRRSLETEPSAGTRAVNNARPIANLVEAAPQDIGGPQSGADGGGKHEIGVVLPEFVRTELHFPEFHPSASADARQALRKGSFALANITYFPMFRLAFELWEKYDKTGVDWRNENEWKDGLARLAGDVVENGEKVAVMARDFDGDDDTPAVKGNPRWKDLILVPQFDHEGKLRGHVLSSTRNTRDAAFYYLAAVAKVQLPNLQPKQAAAAKAATPKELVTA